MRDEILIAGAGIGGLAAALSLHAAGFPVRVFESVPELKPLGVGINLLPHAVRELEELGLRETLETQGVACRELAYFTKRWAVIDSANWVASPAASGLARLVPARAEVVREGVRVMGYGWPGVLTGAGVVLGRFWTIRRR